MDGSTLGLENDLALMDVDDRSLPPLPGSNLNPSIHTIPSVSAFSSGPSQDPESSRAHRRTSRLSRASERESLEEEIKRTVKSLKRQVEDERQRADDAEGRLREVTAHLKAVNDARLLAIREAARAKEELRLYRMQLDNAQHEIYRAQDVINLVDRQRLNAEKEAAQSRSKARRLNETLLVQQAREEAWRLGLQEGLDRGRELAAANERYEAEQDMEYSSQGSRSPSPDHRSYQPPRSRHSRAPSNAEPPQPSPSPVPVPLPANPPGNTYPSDNARPVSIRSRNAPPSRPPSAHPSENIRPMSIRNVSPFRPPSVHPSENIRPVSIRGVSPTPRMHDVVVPPDNLIPTLDADMRIRLPPPHEFIQRTPDRPPSPALHPGPAMSDTSHASQDPLPVLPRTYDQQQPQQQQHSTRHRRNSSSGSSSLSQLDIINNPYNPAFRTPMSAIPEVSSAYSGSPQVWPEHGEHSMRHQRSVSENSFQQPRPPSIQDVEVPQNQRRPPSRSSYAGSYHPVDQHGSRTSITSSAPNIKVQAPSQHSSKADSLWGAESRPGRESPAPSQRAPLPSNYENHNYTHASSSTSHAMPGEYGNHDQPVPPSSPYTRAASLQHENQNFNRNQRYSSNPNNDDDAVSSAMSAETLTTPPARHRPPPPEPDWSSAVQSAGHMPIQPFGSSTTTVWPVPGAAIGVSMSNGQRNGGRMG